MRPQLRRVPDRSFPFDADPPRRRRRFFNWHAVVAYLVILPAIWIGAAALVAWAVGWL